MQLKIVWQQGSSNPENANHFATISQWWAKLSGKEITWRQRLIPPSGEVSDLDWAAQRFDEKFLLTTPEIRGTTLYWRKPDSPQERNITVHKLELDTPRQQLYIFPLSQKEVVIRVGIPEIVYQTIELTDPQIQLSGSGGSTILTMRDEKQQIEVKVNLSSDKFNQLKQQLS